MIILAQLVDATYLNVYEYSVGSLQLRNTLFDIIHVIIATLKY